MLEVFEDVEQGTEEWKKLRAGIPTASEFATLMAKAKGRDGNVRRGDTSIKLLHDKAGELITGEPCKSFSNSYMDRGNELEHVARELYEAQTGYDVVQIGFMKNEHAGCSPDGVVADDGGVEIKIRIPRIQIETLLKDKVPSGNIAQIQGTLWVSKRKWWDYFSYCPGMPTFTKRVFPDLEYHERLEREITAFNEELEELVKRLICKF